MMSNELAVRCHLRIMDEKGITRLVGKRDGRAITAMGINELDDARVQDKIGFGYPASIILVPLWTRRKPLSGRG